MFLFLGKVLAVKYNPEIHHRKSIRLKGYDYLQDGAYFITICVENRECLFGKIVNREMQLNEAGKMIQKWWLELKNKFSNLELDVFVVMPNHFHGVVVLQKYGGADLCICPKTKKMGERVNKKTGEHVGSLPEIIQWFKTMTTNAYILGVKSGKFPPFDRRVWQRNYYEHIIRNEKSWEKIKNYIIQNPERWKNDKFL